jgi:peptidoglycan/LPS O-acetylase OafA/YrhL
MRRDSRSNLYLFKSSQNYFTSEQSANPFLHTWSLGVEEQFYFLFSLLFMLLPFGVYALRLSASTTVVRCCVIGLCLVLSFGLWERPDAVGMANYYLIHCRFWELGAGSLCAQLMAGVHRMDQVNFYGHWLVSLRSFLLSCILLVALAPALSIHAAISLSVGLSVGLIIINGVVPVSLANSQLLGSKEFVGVGLVSYSLYLWHWPVFDVFRLTVGLSGLTHAALAMAITAALATASYVLIEKSMRYSKHSPQYMVFVLILIVASAAGLGVAAETKPGLFYVGSRQDWTRDWLPAGNEPYLDGDRLTARNCDLLTYDPKDGEIPPACQSINGAGVPVLPLVAAFGDSLSYADWGMLAKLDRNQRARVAAMSRDGYSLDFKPNWQADCGA